MPQAVIDDVYLDRRSYLKRYQERSRPVIDAERGSWPRDTSDLLGRLSEWVEPLMSRADHICAGINERILLDVRPCTGTEAAAEAPSEERIVPDFLDRHVVRWDGQDCCYTFRIARPLIEGLVRRREQDWVNHLFLSCRFSAARKGPYNEYVFSFLQALSPAGLDYVERYYAERDGIGPLARAGDYVVQRHCPHLGADLERFGVVEGGILTCQLHGWEFDLATGTCLTSDDRRLFSERRLGTEDELPAVPAADAPTRARAEERTRA
ncbi:Rieske (2Fe-2S) protein [Streptomyces sp. PU-14G]|uniref:Rieske (2Fe-2S) protein n=1 Tax=Streptomyces sp. PU-14G TaxID=2800808 RepID=UPI0034DE46BF